MIGFGFLYQWLGLRYLKFLIWKEKIIKMPKPVLSKKDFVRRYAKGEFGNASPTWNNFEEWTNRRIGLGDLYHIRNCVAGGPTLYNVISFQMFALWEQMVKKCGAEQLYISAMAPTDKTLLQGEVQRGLWGLDLYYTTVAKPMREALKMWSSHTRGIIATWLLQHYLCQNSHDWLTHLLEEYPDHVVEFSTYSVEWGTVPGYNTVFWEIRKY